MAAPVQDAYGNYQPGGAISSGSINFIGTQVPLLTGSVAPNGNIYAPSGSVYSQIINGVFQLQAIKTTAQNLNTGWV